MIFLSGDIDTARLAELRAIAPHADLRFFQTQAALEADVEQAEVIAGFISRDALARASSLRWVHSWAAGPNSQLYPEIVRSSVVLTSSKGNGAIPLAEHAMMLMLMLNRDALRWIGAQRENRWESFFHGELNGLTCAVLGTGASGQDLALKAKAFHMRTIGLRRGKRHAPGFDKMFTQEQLHEFLSQADFLVVTAPYTPETHGMLGAPEFRAMKPTAHYICISRGGIADDSALLLALKESWIAGAGLDAHGIEPLPTDSPFWNLDNVIITPHNGATTHATKSRAYEIFRDNLRRWIEGSPLLNVVDKQLGY